MNTEGAWDRGTDRIRIGSGLKEKFQGLTIWVGG